MKIEGGTSDKILHFARGHVDDIFKKLGISEESKPEETDTREMLKTNSNSDASSESLEQESLGLSEASASSSTKNPCSNDISLVSPSTSSIAADVDSAASNEKENVTEENSLGSIF